MFTRHDYDRTLIIDDQYAVIHPDTRGNLLLSKKFMRHTQTLCSK
jgi:hypothetical protein